MLSFCRIESFSGHSISPPRVTPESFFIGGEKGLIILKEPSPMVSLKGPQGNHYGPQIDFLKNPRRWSFLGGPDIKR